MPKLWNRVTITVIAGALLAGGVLGTVQLVLAPAPTQQAAPGQPGAPDRPAQPAQPAQPGPLLNPEPMADGSLLASPAAPYVGAYLAEGFKGLPSFEAMTGAQVNMYLFFKSWGKQPVLDVTEYQLAHDAGVLPLIAWEPWDPEGSSTDQPAYTLQSIVDGQHDQLITSWAQGLRDLRFPVAIRFAHEMNGHWYPWSTTVNGNTPELYVAAWRHVHDVFEAEGATNVAWVWSPNNSRFLTQRPLAQIYPGDDYVDIVGIVGYGTSNTDSFEVIFGSTMTEVRQFTQKPFLITETSIQHTLADQPGWIRQYFTDMAARPDMLGMVWFNALKRADWRLETGDPANPAAFGEAVLGLRNAWAAR
jgi:mannan endo-1,4-beta-mannosidase